MRVKIVLGMLAFAAMAAAQDAAPPAPPKPPKPPAPAKAPRAVTVDRTVTLSGGSGSYLGIGLGEITAERAKALKLKEERGAEITRVEADSPAAKAGIKEGDVVLEFNGQPVQGVTQFTRMVQETPPERQVKIVVWRNGGSQTLTATVGERRNANTLRLFGDGNLGEMLQTIPRNMAAPTIDIPRFNMSWQNPRLGIVGEALGQEQQLADFFGVKEGVLVKSVEKNSAAEKGGIKAGDIIVKIGDAKITTTEEITRALRGVKSGANNLTVTVTRNKKETPLTVTVDVPNNTGFAPAAARLVKVQERVQQAQQRVQQAQLRMQQARQRAQQQVQLRRQQMQTQRLNQQQQRLNQRLNERLIKLRQKTAGFGESLQI
jgi:serine protease Do